MTEVWSEEGENKELW